MKKIRLTESELTRLVRRIVEDTERVDDIEIDDIEIQDEMSKQEAIRKIAEFLKDEVLDDLSPREIKTLERKVEKSENNVSENIYEDDEDLSSRKSSRRSLCRLKSTPHASSALLMPCARLTRRLPSSALALPNRISAPIASFPTGRTNC